MICRAVWFIVSSIMLALVLILVVSGDRAASSTMAEHSPFSTKRSAQPTQTTTEKDQLERQKLQEEIRKLQSDNDRQSSLSGVLLLWAPFITALVAVLTIGITVWKQTNDTAAQRKEFLRQLEADRSTRKLESERQFDESIARTIENLGSTQPVLRVSAAARLLASLRSSHQEYYDEILILLLANLKYAEDAHMADLLVRGIVRALKYLATTDRLEQALPRGLILPKSQLQGLDLSGLELAPEIPVDLAFSDCTLADLSNAKLMRLRGAGINLTGAKLINCDLTEARLNQSICNGARFHSSRLVSATLKGASLGGARFHQAALQSAHLEGTNCEWTSFNGSDLNDTYFINARFDVPSLRSIILAKNWRQAHFDESVRSQLVSLAEGTSQPDG